MNADVNLGGQTAASMPPRGWWSRNWKWFVPSALLLLIIGCCGCPAGIFFGIVHGMKNAEPYTMALKELRENPTVKEKLGEPIQEPFMPAKANYSFEGDSGTADYLFNVSGPKGSAEVQFQAKRIGGKWGFQRFQVQFADGTKLDLAASAKSELEDAPPFNP